MLLYIAIVICGNQIFKKIFLNYFRLIFVVWHVHLPTNIMYTLFHNTYVPPCAKMMTKEASDSTNVKSSCNIPGTCCCLAYRVSYVNVYMWK